MGAVGGEVQVGQELLLEADAADAELQDSEGWTLQPELLLDVQKSQKSSS